MGNTKLDIANTHDQLQAPMRLAWLLSLSLISAVPNPVSEPGNDGFQAANQFGVSPPGWQGNEFKRFGLSPDLFPEEHQEASLDLDESGYVQLPQGRNQATNQTLNVLRKFRQLKSMILFLQDKPSFGKYCWYGCWCFIEGSNNLNTGYGMPRDEIDTACMRFSRCYRCLAMDFQNFDENMAYDFDVNHENKEITCNNPVGTSRRSLCECDKELALELAQHEKSWKKKYHEQMGKFDRKHQCYTPLGKIKADECCGTYPHRFPFTVVIA